jgi:hypothetical protein
MLLSYYETIRVCSVRYRLKVCAPWTRWRCRLADSSFALSWVLTGWLSVMDGPSPWIRIQPCLLLFALTLSPDQNSETYVRKSLLNFVLLSLLSFRWQLSEKFCQQFFVSCTFLCSYISGQLYVRIWSTHRIVVVFLTEPHFPSVPFHPCFVCHIFLSASLSGTWNLSCSLR